MVVMIVYVLLIAAIVLGLWRGGGPERIVAAVLIGMIAVDRVAHVLLAGYNPTSLDQFHLVRCKLYAKQGDRAKARAEFEEARKVNRQIERPDALN